MAILHYPSAFFIESGFFQLNSELTNLASLASSRLLGGWGLPCLCLPKLELQAAAMLTQHLCGFWGSESEGLNLQWVKSYPFLFLAEALAGSSLLSHLGLRFLISFPKQSVAERYRKTQ